VLQVQFCSTGILACVVLRAIISQLPVTRLMAVLSLF
jgi:hypothetical protein